MIFYDKKTAKQVRELATKELQDFIIKTCTELLDYQHRNPDTNISDETVKDHVKNKLTYDLLGWPKILLNKSGLIFPETNGMYPVNLYYDDMNKTDTVIKIQGGVSGGIVDGHIHT